MERDRALAAGAALTHTGRRMQALYVLRSGSAKCFSVSTDGEELVRGFCLPGELIGLEGLAEHRDSCEVVALEPARYCRIPVRRFEFLMDILPGLRREVVRMLSQSLEVSSRTRTRLISTDASTRVAGFLLDLARRLERRGILPHEFELSMTRRDIARHLGLTVETVSRELSSFKRAGWLDVRARQISILAPGALASLSEHPA
ncbi:MAG TPA: helix-turn-helix domain-containing protein [Steroidobacteraceae bacterium]|nr:helix-turn-helix domain-containing protein [Steroidobacteraceae bacterium]